MNKDDDQTVLAGSDDLTGTTVGRFRITALLGKGGMGEVYLAEDSLLKRAVALKRLNASLRSNPQYRELLIKEAERASRLNDERVAHIHDVVDHKGEVFLVMEFVDGESLRSRIGIPMPAAEFMPIAVQCVEALVVAHQNQILHRDIKPENIMLTAKGRVKICDFGLARQGAWIEDTTLLDGTPTIGFRGTPAYMAPEALLNKEPDFRADMFSLGIVFYEMLTGVHPFRDGNNHMSTADRIIHAEQSTVAQRNTVAPQKLSNIIDTMLEKDPADRYATPNDLLADLNSIDLEKPDAPHSTLKPALVASAVLLIVLAITVGSVIRRGARLSTAQQHHNLVVLPFRAINDARENQIYSDGLTDTVTAELSRALNGSGLQVAPAPEVRARRVGGAPDARKQFAADLVLAGTVHESGDIVSLTYSLYETDGLRQLSADTISKNASNRIAVQEQLVAAVLSAIHAGNESRPREPAVPAAYDSYVQGRGYLRSTSPETLQTAIQSFQRAAELDPGYATAYAALGEAYFAKYDTTKEPVWVELAREACEKADSLDHNSTDAKVCLGNVNYVNGRYETAIGDFESALSLDSGNDAAYLGLATAYEKSGNNEAAEKTYRRAIQLRPNYYLGYTRLGQYYLRRARYLDAADQFQKEITLVPNGEQAYLRVGAVYIYLGRYEDAITVLRRSIELRPTAGAFSNLGSTYLRLHRFNEAIPIFEEAARIFPRNFIFAGNLARAYYWAPNQKDKSAAAYERAIALASDELQVNPRNADAHIMLARYSAMLGLKVEALSHLNQALALRPGEAEYFSIAAVVHNQLGNRSAAIAAIKKAISLKWSKAEIKSEIEFENLRMDPEFTSAIEG